MLMKETNFSEGEDIYSNSSEDQNLYYIIKGTLQVYDRNNEHQIKGLIETGSFFGFENFFLDQHPRDILRS